MGGITNRDFKLFNMNQLRFSNTTSHLVQDDVMNILLRGGHEQFFDPSQSHWNQFLTI